MMLECSECGYPYVEEDLEEGEFQCDECGTWLKTPKYERDWDAEAKDKEFE